MSIAKMTKIFTGAWNQYKRFWFKFCTPTINSFDFDIDLKHRWLNLFPKQINNCNCVKIMLKHKKISLRQSWAELKTK